MRGASCALYRVVRHFALLREARSSACGSRSGQFPSAVWGRWPALVMELASAVGVVASVLFLIWFVRSATNARALGLPARRSPAAGVAGFMLPVVNLWWPYQSTRDLFPERHSARPLVLRWFLLWVVGGIVGSAVLLVAVFVDSWVGWVMLAVPVVLTTLAALDARSVIAEAVAAHAELRSEPPPPQGWPPRR